MTDWLSNSFTKVVCKVNNKELNKATEGLALRCCYKGNTVSILSFLNCGSKEKNNES